MYNPYREKYIYEASGKEYPVPVAHGWCHSCGFLSNIEEFIGIMDRTIKVAGMIDLIEDQKTLIEKEINKFSLFSNKSKITRLNLQLTKYQEEMEIEYSLLELSELLENRNSSPRCLVCGSTDIEPALWPLEESVIRGNNLGIFHPDCGGLIIVEDGMQYSTSRVAEIIKIDIEGHRIN